MRATALICPSARACRFRPQSLSAVRENSCRAGSTARLPAAPPAPGRRARRCRRPRAGRAAPAPRWLTPLAVVTSTEKSSEATRTPAAAASLAVSTTEEAPVSNTNATARPLTVPGTMNSPPRRRRIDDLAAGADARHRGPELLHHAVGDLGEFEAVGVDRHQRHARQRPEQRAPESTRAAPDGPARAKPLTVSQSSTETPSEPRAKSSCESPSSGAPGGVSHSAASAASSSAKGASALTRRGRARGRRAAARERAAAMRAGSSAITASRSASAISGHSEISPTVRPQPMHSPARGSTTQIFHARRQRRRHGALFRRPGRR